jgi:hypothetical protein
VSDTNLERFLTMSAFEAAYVLRTFRKRQPTLTDAELVQLAKAVNINFFPHDFLAGQQVERLISDSNHEDLELFFTNAIDIVIAMFQPFWVRLAPSGRSSVCAAIGDNGKQCFRNAGLLGTTERAIAWWDRMANNVRLEQDAARLMQGRHGERLSFEREREWLRREGVDKVPEWVALEDNSLGYDILSYRWHEGHLVNRLIEVKTTYTKPPFIILTKNEWWSADRFGDAFEYHIWTLPDEVLSVRAVEEVRPHIPHDVGGGTWLDARIPAG